MGLIITRQKQKRKNVVFLRKILMTHVVEWIQNITKSAVKVNDIGYEVRG